MKLYAYPRGDQRRCDFVAAKSLAAARMFHVEARNPDRRELEAAIVSLMSVDVLTGKGRAKRDATAADFGFADATPEFSIADDWFRKRCGGSKASEKETHHE